LKGDGNAAKANLTGPEISTGYIREFGGGFFGGGAFRFADKRLKVNGISSSSDIQSLGIALYAGKDFGSVRIMAAGEINRHDIDSERLTFGNNPQKLTAGYNAWSYILSAGISWLLPVSESLDLEPYALYSWHNIKTDGFVETGGSAAITNGGESFDRSSTSVGLRADIHAGSMLTINLEAGWRHMFGKNTPESTFAFAEGSSSFTIAGAPLNRNELLVGAGVTANLSERTAIKLNYSGNVGKHALSHSGEVTFKVVW
jgi:outer membrane autotransporter protein